MNRNVIVPAKKRVNPWTVARVYWWVPVAAAYVASWPLAIVGGGFQGTPETVWGFLAALFAIVGNTCLIGFGLGAAIVHEDDIAAWWRDRESSYGQVDDR